VGDTNAVHRYLILGREQRYRTSEPEYPIDLLIPPIAQIQQPESLTQTHHPLQDQWERYFHREHLSISLKLRKATYHWVAHLLTVHPTRIHHPIYGLTSLDESGPTLTNLTVPQVSPEETIVIPSTTRCSDCKLACEQIHQIETECAQNQAFEDQTWSLLQAALVQTVETPPIEPDWYTQAFQDFQNGTDFQPTFGHGNPTAPEPSGTIYAPRSPSNVHDTTVQTKPATIFPQGSSTWNAEPTGSNGHTGPALDKRFDAPALPTEPPRRV
jgi:hypothetical protein